MGRLGGQVVCTVAAGRRRRLFPSRSRSRSRSSNVQSHGNDGIGIFHVFGTKRAEVAAMPVIKERDTVALYRILAQLFASLNARHIVPARFLDVYLSGVRVAFELGPDIHPPVWSFGNRCKRRVKRNSAYVAVGSY